MGSPAKGSGMRNKIPTQNFWEHEITAMIVLNKYDMETWFDKLN
jgi:hypothetical protein